MPYEWLALIIPATVAIGGWIWKASTKSANLTGRVEELEKDQTATSQKLAKHVEAYAELKEKNIVPLGFKVEQLVKDQQETKEQKKDIDKAIKSIFNLLGDLGTELAVLLERNKDD